VNFRLTRLPESEYKLGSLAFTNPAVNVNDLGATQDNNNLNTKDLSGGWQCDFRP